MDTIKVIRIALSVVNERLIAILALAMAFGLGCWTMWGPDWRRVVTLSIFVVFGYLLTRKERHGIEKASSPD